MVISNSSDVPGLDFSGFGRSGLYISGLGRAGLFCIGFRAFFRAFPKYKMYPHFCIMSMKYEVLLLDFLKLSVGYKFGPI